ncbi:hypothetical protein, partial [Streptomyces beijiangensis]
MTGQQLQWLVTYRADAHGIRIHGVHPSPADPSELSRLLHRAHRAGQEHYQLPADNAECARAHTLGAWARLEIGDGTLIARLQAQSLARGHAWEHHHPINQARGTSSTPAPAPDC